MEDMHIYTIGHSTRSLEDFIDILKQFHIKLLADVRSIPRSRHNPQLNSDPFSRELDNHRITYQHLEGLGGLRKTRADSPNAGWRNVSFRGYADYMQTQEFEEALGHLIKQATTQTTALMCAEALPWRCHRWLISDALLVRDVGVQHIMDKDKTQPATLTGFARIKGTDITYPSLDDDQQSLLD